MEQTVSVHILVDGAYTTQMYGDTRDDDPIQMEPQTQIKVGIFEDLIIDTNSIFAELEW